MAFAALLGGITYRIALESAIQAAETRREDFVTTLSAGEGPVS